MEQELAERSEKIPERFARAMQSPYVGGRRLPHAITASAKKRKCEKSAKPNRARAVEMLLKAGEASRRK